jgi:hypothetical protein
MLDYLLLTLCVLAATVHGEPYLQGDGEMFIRDGIVNLVGFTGTVFQVLNYVPVCGTLSNSLSAQIDLSGSHFPLLSPPNPVLIQLLPPVDKCTTAMSTFNTTSATSGIYDLSGVKSTESPGTGTPLCVCGAFGTSTAKSGDPNTNGLLCVLVNEKGLEENWWSMSTDARVASSFQLSAQGKSLPHCNAVDLVSMSKASMATRTAAVNSASSATTPTSVATSGKGGGSTGNGTPNPTGT